MKETIADRIRKSREKKGLSQSALAKLTGHSDKSAISKLEHSGDNISMKQIRRVAEALDVSAAYLMGWEDLESFATPEDFEKAWKDSGGGRHPIILTDDEYSFIVDVRAMHDKDFYKRMKLYMDLFAKKDTDKGGII